MLKNTVGVCIYIVYYNMKSGIILKIVLRYFSYSTVLNTNYV